MPTSNLDLPTVALAPPQVERIGRYRIDAQLGRGASGVVYRATDLVIQRSVAIKTVERPGAQSSAGDHEAYARFLRESRAAGQLSHPNVVTVFDVGCDETLGLSYIAMEFVDGEPLDRLLRRRHALSFAQIRSIGEQVASALDAAHQAGVIHRDIKPANLILTAAGTIKVADFGIAKITSQSMTQDGSFLGSPSYMSPEQVRSESLDHRTDVFSLGTVLYELVTLTPAFGGSNVFDVIQRVASAKPRPPRELRPDVPEELEAVVLRAMSREREQRFASAAEMRDALVRILASATQSLGIAIATTSAVSSVPDETPPSPVAEVGLTPATDPAPRGARPRTPSLRAGLRVMAGAATVLVLGGVAATRWSRPVATVAALAPEAASPSPSALMTPGVTTDPVPVATPELVPSTPPPATPASSPLETPRPKSRPVAQRPLTDPRGTPRGGPSPSPAPAAVVAPPPASPFPYHFVAVHGHSLGKKCRGHLRMDLERLVFDSETDDGDDRDWAYSDIKSASFAKGELSLVVNERGKLGRDRRFNLKIEGGVIPAEALSHLDSRIAGSR